MIKNNVKIVDTASSIPQSLNSISNFRFLICVCSKNDTCSKAYSFEIIFWEGWEFEKIDVAKLSQNNITLRLTYYKDLTILSHKWAIRENNKQSL